MNIAGMPRRVVDAAIAGYQRHLSPRKGYRCAYGEVHGDQTCSAAVRESSAGTASSADCVPP